MHFASTCKRQDISSKNSLIFIVKLRFCAAYQRGVKSSRFKMANKPKQEALRTSLHHAVRSGDEQAVAELLAQDPSLLHETDSRKRTPLDYAVFKEHSAIVSLLIAYGSTGEEAERALCWAASAGHGELVAQILAKWRALIARNLHSSVLDSAVRRNQVAVVAQLLAVDPAVLNRGGSWLLAANLGHDEVLKVMLSYGTLCSFVGEDGTALTEAAKEGHESTVALLLAKRPELIHLIQSKSSPIVHYAAEQGYVNIVKQLLSCKPELIDTVDSFDATVLHAAASAASAPVAAKDKGRNNPTPAELIDFILDRRPGLSDAVDCWGQNALHVAATQNYPARSAEVFFKLLARNPRSIDVVSMDNKNTLHLATQGKDPQVLEAVLSLRPELACMVDSGNNTALHCLCQFGRGCDGERQAALEPFLDKLWQLNPSALEALNDRSLTPFGCSGLHHSSRWAVEFFQRKLSWDEIVRSYGGRQSSKFQSFREHAEGLCGSSLSGALPIPGVIGIVKEYFFDVGGEELLPPCHLGGKRRRTCDWQGCGDGSE